MSFLIVLLNIYNRKRKFLYICVFPIFIFFNFKQKPKKFGYNVACAKNHDIIQKIIYTSQKGKRLF